jgi:predicted metal-binding protein
MKKEKVISTPKRKRSAAKRPAPETYVKAALAAGADDAKLISPRTVATAQWVRLKCQFGCGGYGRSLTCPPHSPLPEKTALLLREYRAALLIHARRPIGMTRLTARLERRAFLDGYHRALGLGAGPCEICRACPPLSEGGCRHPERARPAMEACGIDVFATARRNGLPIDVVAGRRRRQDYYALLLLE